jgi:ABC-2 type transport system ATP-binding protein/lipopolysaccharide transport system ATP-binding protein
MAHISIKNLSLDIPIYGTDARSLKTELLARAVGGRIRSDSRKITSVKAIDNISLEIPEGARIGLTGHNGAGKSTLLRVLAGIYAPTQGSVEISGNVGVLIDQHAGMLHEETGLENIRLKGISLGISPKKMNSMISEIIEFSELGDFIHVPIKTYSAGMVSRLAFAIVTSINPEILIIDEGIGAGDAAFQEKVRRRIDSMLAKVSIVVAASHNEDLLKNMKCEKYIFDKGRILL